VGALVALREDNLSDRDTDASIYDISTTIDSITKVAISSANHLPLVYFLRDTTSLVRTGMKEIDAREIAKLVHSTTLA